MSLGGKPNRNDEGGDAEASARIRRSDRPADVRPASRPDPLIGATVDGRFRIVAPIARGGMSRVYRAEQAALGRFCALKVLTPQFDGAHEEEFFKRFFLEASIASKLSHPNTVRIFDYGHSDELDVFYIAMELVDGRTLYQALRDDGPFDEARTAHVGVEIARALREAHDVGVAHRDLKPSNIMLQDREGELEGVKVLDFGLVKDFTGGGEDLTETGMFLGSPKYMAPEQVLDGAAGPASDVYALGVMLYEMLTGKVPFDKGVGTLVAHVNDAVPPLSAKNPNVTVSPEFQAIVMRCLEKDPARRFVSMRSLTLSLRNIAGGPVSMTDTQEGMAALPLSMRSPPHVADDRVPPSSREGAEAVSLSGPPPSITATLRGAAVSQAPGPSQGATRASPQDRASGIARRKFVLFGVASLAVVAVALSLFRSFDVESTAPSGLVATGRGASDSPREPPLPRFDAALRQLRVETSPGAAAVWEGDRQVCTTTPCMITWRGANAAGAHRLRLEKAGFRPLALGVDDSEEIVTARLDALAWGAVATGSTADSAISAPEVATELPALPNPDPPVVAAPMGGVIGAATPEPRREPVEPTRARAPIGVVPFGEGMTRPTFVSGQMPVYTREALEAKVQGKVLVKCVVERAGSLSGCRILKGLPFMDQAVLSAMATQRYVPVTLSGQPVACDYVFTLRLVLP